MKITILKLSLSYLDFNDKDKKESFLKDLKEGHIPEWAVSRKDLDKAILTTKERV